MFESLVASGPQARVGAHRYVLSVSLHGALIAGAVALTRHPTTPGRAGPADPSVVYLAPQPVRRPPALANHAPLSRARPPAPAWPPRVETPDLALPALSANVPTTADLVEAAKIEPGAAPGLPDFGPGAGTSLTSELLTPVTVDEPVEVVEQPAPRYPRGLAQAGVTGRVELEYVVDTTGRAEPGSLRTVMATHPAFEAAARASVVASRYRPARLGGRMVRQLVRQTFTFRSRE